MTWSGLSQGWNTDLFWPGSCVEYSPDLALVMGGIMTWSIAWVMGGILTWSGLCYGYQAEDEGHEEQVNLHPSNNRLYTYTIHYI